MFDSEPYGRHAPVAVQQPFGQEVASQVQLPAWHSCPVEHAPQTTPLLPHAEEDSLDDATHVLDAGSQQPAHALPSQVHAPLAQVWEPAHSPHAEPALPHVDDDCQA